MLSFFIAEILIIFDTISMVNLLKTSCNPLVTYKRENDLEKTFNSRSINNHFSKYLIVNINHKNKLYKL